MSIDNNFFDSLKNKLDDQTEWPSLYMFKFIIPANNRKMALIEALFGAEAQISTRPSKTGKFISSTIKVVVLSSDEVINIYKKAADIEGLIAL